MSAIRPRDLLTDDLLASLGGPGALTQDIRKLADVGYLNVALPQELGGLGCTLRQAACGQRRLARHAPEAAVAVSAHLYWTGAAADACRAGDESVRWILDEAARGALFAGGHGDAGADLKLADPGSRCEPDGAGSYVFRDRAALDTATPSWDWVAVRGVHVPTGAGRPQFVIGFAGRGGRCTPGFRIARVGAPGTPSDVFSTSALTWGHSILASVQYSDARRALNEAITAYAEAMTPEAFVAPGGLAEPSVNVVPAQGTGARTGGRWPIAEASARLDAMKSRIADITHPWQQVRDQTPDLGGQHLINLHAMRHEVAEGAASVHALASQLTGTHTVARPLHL
jgi:alkylation response protein AidB-like acyl-CoA dehydrogenase